MPTEFDLIIRVLVAAGLGALVGFEREISEKPAGLRTHALVALGSALFTVAGFAAAQDALVFGNSATSHYNSNVDLGRIAAQVVTGMGFLGGGIIIFHGDKLRGLTTAAELWAVAAIGMLCGFGYLALAFSTTIGVLFILIVGKPIEKMIDRVRVHTRAGSGNGQSESEESSSSY